MTKNRDHDRGTSSHTHHAPLFSPVESLSNIRIDRLPCCKLCGKQISLNSSKLTSIIKSHFQKRPQAHFPSVDWLEAVKTREARARSVARRE